VTDDTALFAALVAELDYPMCVATAASGDDVDGCLVGFAAQCSIAPRVGIEPTTCRLGGGCSIR
jgi:hypothetical protein